MSLRLAMAAAAVLTLAACASVEPQDSTDRPMRYACVGGSSFTAAYAKDGRRAYVTAAGQTYTLSFSPPNRSTGGLKFMKKGVVLQALGPVASLDGAQGGPYRDCKAG
jgi:hypothetical protein